MVQLPLEEMLLPGMVLPAMLMAILMAGNVEQCSIGDCENLGEVSLGSGRDIS